MFGLAKNFLLLPQGFCGLSSSTKRNMLLIEFGMLPVQVFCWHQTLRLWNSLAASPVGNLFHTALLDSLCDASHDDAFNDSSSVAACLHGVGVSMPHTTNRVPVMEISAVMVADIVG